MRRTIRVVLETLYSRLNTVFIALKVNNAVVLLVAATNMASCNASIVVTAARLGLFLQERRVRTTFVQLIVHYAYVVTTAC